MDQRPNILFFFSDQQRWDTAGCYGKKLPVTPNLDRMAAEGVLFENAFTMQPVCGPARACLQTGLYATQTGCYRNGITLPGAKTLADHFHEAGYQTAYVGKWHLASTDDPQYMHPNADARQRPAADFHTLPVPPERRGGYRDYWMAADVLEFTSHGYDGYVYNADMEKEEFKGYRADRITDFALDFLDRADRDRPFFLFLSHIEPHHQNDHNRYEGPLGSRERFAGFETPGDLQGTEGNWRENYPDYLGCCHSLDENLGRIRAKLAQNGQADNTVIFYTSDHGTHFKTRNREYKRACHDGCIHVPLVACGPGFHGGRRVDELVSLMDLPATLLDCAGIHKPERMQGRPLQPLAEGSCPDWEDHVFLQISESQVGRAIRTRKWKYSVRDYSKDGWKDAQSDRYEEDFLYDLEADPYERNNLVLDSRYAPVRGELSELLISRMLQAGEPRPEILPATQRESRI